MTIDKTKLGNKREGLNTVADEVNTNETDVAANAAAITAVKGTGWTTETIKGNADDISTNSGDISTNSDDISTNSDDIDALERSGSTIAVDGTVASVSRNVTLTIKDGAGVAVTGYHVVGVKVTNGDGAGADAGTPAVIATDLDTTDGLVVGAAGEQISPSNNAAIADTGNASLLAFTKVDGTLTVQLNKDSGNDFFFVHFLLPDGSVVSGDEIELGET